MEDRESGNETSPKTDSAELCRQALTLLRDKDPGYLKLLTDSAEAGCREAQFLLGIQHYLASGISDRDGQRFLEESGRIGYAFCEYLRSYPSDFDSYLCRKKDFDDAMLERSLTWFGLSENEQEYFRKRALERFGNEIGSDRGIYITTPTKYRDWTEWANGRRNDPDRLAIAAACFESGDYEKCLAECSGSDMPEALFLAGRCCERLGDTEAALKRYRRASADEPEAAYAAYRLLMKEPRHSAEETHGYLNKAVTGNVRAATRELFVNYLTDGSSRPKIMETLEKAFDNGNYDARAYQGFIFFFGLGTETDLGSAMQCFEDSLGRCTYGAYVGFLLGYMYLNGLGGEPHLARGKALIGRYSPPGTDNYEETVESIRNTLTSTNRSARTDSNKSDR